MDTTKPQPTVRAAFSIAEVLAQTGIGRDKLYKLINSGSLTARKIGRRTVILATDLQAFLEALPTIGRTDER
jgi:excisionase family DNA binding protein